MTELIDKLGYMILAAIIMQILTNIVVVAVLKNKVKNVEDKVKDIDGKATRAHARIDDINAFLRNYRRGEL